MLRNRQPVVWSDIPGDCRRILIVGAGGFGREVLQWACDAWPAHTNLIAGFLSDDLLKLDGIECHLAIVSSVTAYRLTPGDYLLLGIGVPYSRKHVAQRLEEQGARFLTLVHPRAVVADNCRIGTGAIVCPNAVISDSATLGRFALVNYHASLGHDSFAGDFVVLSPYATLGGHSRVEDEGFLGLHASVGPGKTVGSRTKVSANSCVLSSAPGDSIVYGVPGRIASRIDVSIAQDAKDARS